MVNICNVSQTPPKDNVLSTDAVKVNATITHVNPLELVVLNCTYSNGSATWTSIISMTNLEDDIWNGIIPSLPVGTNVTYAIIAQDNAGNSINSTSQGYTFDYPRSYSRISDIRTSANTICGNTICSVGSQKKTHNMISLTRCAKTRAGTHRRIIFS
jgi:hypothetical protein